ncbi:hypothetical protein LTR17_004719 [Elasticomyces elasticus]|nr:hypothetical protein LTR17_004719 [Elasticomyces elasticus]
MKLTLAFTSALATLSFAAPTATVGPRATIPTSAPSVVSRTAGDAAIPVNVVSTHLITDGDGKECLIWHVKQDANVFSPECKEWGPDPDASTKDGQMLELRSVKLADQTKTCAGWYVELHDGAARCLAETETVAPARRRSQTTTRTTITPMALPYPVDENNATAIRLAMDDLKRIHGLETAERQAKLESELGKLTYDPKNATAIVVAVEGVEFRAEYEQMVADSMLDEALRCFQDDLYIIRMKEQGILNPDGSLRVPVAPGEEDKWDRTLSATSLV